MKTMITLVLMITSSIVFAQKKTNGTIYIDHPSIKVIEEMTKAMVAGDEKKVATYLADDFKAFNGVSVNKNDKGQDKAQFLKSVGFWKAEFDYLSITNSPGAYPDALEYKKDNDKDEVWVQTWDDLKGMHKKTGVKIDMPIHRMFLLNKDNKIKTMIDYMNESIFDEIGDSFVERKNGTIYNHHEYINSVRKMLYTFENKDFKACYDFYAEDCRFRDINSPRDKSFTLTEQKANDEKFLKEFEVVGIDVVGYPDYLHYELGDADSVLSWWDFRLIRKSDKKAITLPVFYIHNFNDKGKISREVIYYSAKILEEK